LQDDPGQRREQLSQSQVKQRAFGYAWLVPLAG
jgi:hypothetical protein